MHDLVGLIRQVVQTEMRGQTQSAFGIVEVVHLPDATGLNQYACDIKLQGTDAIYEKVPLTTAYLGHVAPPIVGDVVVLTFIGGDPDQPIISGLVFSDAVSPPEIAAGEALLKLPHDGADDARIDTRQTAGQNGSRSWSVTLPSGPVLTLTDGTISATLDDRTMTLDGDAGEATIQTGGGQITLTDSGDITITGDGALTLEAASDITLKAGANLAVEAGANAEIKSSGTMDVKGAVINLN
ncbi:phage baseplate assembly protein V [Yoonia sp. SS1-5]|uniref:Phage baseplate assembly protein V n=1 Tax=Yoonia rhodophyticola TaxID=3137370 RepID=A0AAN0NM95_9RHOB